MEPHNLKEWAEKLIRAGLDVDFAREVLDLIESAERLEYLEGEVIEPMMKALPNFDQENRALEYLMDQNILLGELADTLDKNGFPGPVDVALGNALDDLESARTELEALKAPQEFDL